MMKRAAGMAALSLLVCGLVIGLSFGDLQSTDTENTAQQVETVIQLLPEANTIEIETETAVGTNYVGGLRDQLVASTDYGTIFPYAARVLGWKQDSTPVYRYALADSKGTILTNAVYSSVLRQQCGNTFVWLLYDENDGERVSCAAADGSWTLGPFNGSITVVNDHIFVRRVNNSTVTTVYSKDGKIMGQIRGMLSTDTDGILVSRETVDEQTLWHIYDADSLTQKSQFYAIEVGSFSDGCAAAQLTQDSWGFVRSDGTFTQVPDMAHIDDCIQGYALAQNTDGMYGVLDVNGKIIVPFDYIDAMPCSEESALYQLWKSEDECVVMYVAGGQKMSLPSDLNAQKLGCLPENYFYYQDEDGQTVVFDDLLRIELTAGTKLYPQGNRTVVAVSDEGYRVIDLSEGKTGKLRKYAYITPQQDCAYDDSSFTIADKETGLQGIATTSRVILKPAYTQIYSVDGTYYAAIQDSWSGIVDADGKWIVRTRLTGVE